MLKQNLLYLALAITAPLAEAWRGVTKTSWDCCKPGCAWPESLKEAKAKGNVRVCDRSDRELSSERGRTEQSSCFSGTPGGGFACSSYQPRPISNDLSIGFAVVGELWACCRCFEVLWLDGGARGKRMQVQAVSNSVGAGTDIIILTPGGGSGPNPQGCLLQHGKTTGRTYGGVSSAAECELLPDNLRSGCYWRFNWARDDLNERNVEITQIACPASLKNISGCDS
ncbi:hypothetical protein RB595_008313 [Gaeumannomyces hyphopodioides]